MLTMTKMGPRYLASRSGQLKLALSFLLALAACDDVPPNVTVSPKAAEAAESTSPAILAAPGGPSAEDSFALAMSICLDSFPDMVAAKAAVRRAGFDNQGRNDGLEFYTTDAENVIAMFSYGDRPARCGFGRDGLRGEAAIAATASALQQAFGNAPVPLDTSDTTDPVAAWLVRLPSGPILVAVRRQMTLGSFFNGSPVLVTSDVAVAGN